MSDFNSILNQFGLQEEAIPVSEPLKNTGGSYYEHKAGNYTALIGRLEASYKDREGKKCAADVAGATVSHFNLKLFIVSDPDGQLIQKGYTYPENLEIGRMTYNVFVTLDAGKQWQNVGLFKNLCFDGFPASAIIQGEKGDESIFLKNFQLFLGAPIGFTIEAGTKEGSRFIKKDSIQMMDKAITKEKILGRKQVIEKLYADYDAKIAKLRAERAAKKNEKSENPIVKTEDPSDFAGDYDFGNI